MLQPGVATLSQLDAQEYLEILQALARELDQAIQAIVTRALPSFEASVARQRAGCARLAEFLASAASRQAQKAGPPAPPLDGELARRIKDAAATLHSLNDRYSALLKHSGDTMRLFANLFRSYTGPAYPSVVVPRPNLHTWSCEL